MQKKLLLFFINFIAWPSFLFSQSYDTRLNYAEELAVHGNRDAAIDSLNKIILEYPDELQARIILGKIYGWNMEYDLARESLFKVIRNDESNIDAYKILIDIEAAEQNYYNIIRYTGFALKYKPYSEDILLNRIRALLEMKRFDEAGENLNKLIEINPTNAEAVKLIDLLNSTSLANKAGVSYNIEIFDDIEPWHYAFVNYSRKFSFGSVGAGVTYANSLNKFGLKFLGNADIVIAQGTYVNLKAAFSKDDIFPKYNFAIEPYYRLANNFIISAGFQNLKYSEESVNIFTGHIGKYLGDYFISLRPYFTPDREQTKISGLLAVKRFFSDTEHFIMLMLGYGFIPLSDFSSFEYTRSNSQKVALLYKIKVTRILNFSAGFLYELEEFKKEEFRNKFNIGIGIQTLF